MARQTVWVVRLVDTVDPASGNIALGQSHYFDTADWHVRMLGTGAVEVERNEKASPLPHPVVYRMYPPTAIRWVDRRELDTDKHGYVSRDAKMPE